LNLAADGLQLVLAEKTSFKRPLSLAVRGLNVFNLASVIKKYSLSVFESYSLPKCAVFCMGVLWPGPNSPSNLEHAVINYV
jgi:hypothetical protein